MTSIDPDELTAALYESLSDEQLEALARAFTLDGPPTGPADERFTRGRLALIARIQEGRRREGGPPPEEPD